MKSFATEMHAVIQLLAQFLSNEILVLGGLTHVLSKGVQRRQGKARKKKKKKNLKIHCFFKFLSLQISVEIPQMLKYHQKYHNYSGIGV